MTPAIKIKTQFGQDTYYLIHNQFNEHKKNGIEHLTSFKERCIEDYNKAEKILGDWLDDDSSDARMDDLHPENWQKFYTMNDLCASLKYFSTRSL